ncbi:MAG TPA: hypothetical protein VGQ25_06015 [Gemmatimonadales bacterium]|jgi:hypothetical protein|nr:hypothetical protein [Gemmatimonadales bacterium]
MVITAVTLVASAALAQVRAPFPSPVVHIRGPSAVIRDSSVYANRIVEHGRRLDFDELDGVGDQQRLMLGRCDSSCSYGPLATIQPYRNTHRINSAQQDSGVIVARIISDGAYPKFNIHGRDTVYWWVRLRKGDSVSVFASTAPEVRARVSDLAITPHSPRTYNRALARWVWTDRDEEAWVTCDGGRCCRSSGLEF